MTVHYTLTSKLYVDLYQGHVQTKNQQHKLHMLNIN